MRISKTNRKKNKNRKTKLRNFKRRTKKYIGGASHEEDPLQQTLRDREIEIYQRLREVWHTLQYIIPEDIANGVGIVEELDADLAANPTGGVTLAVAIERSVVDAMPEGPAKEAAREKLVEEEKAKAEVAKAMIYQMMEYYKNKLTESHPELRDVIPVTTHTFNIRGNRRICSAAKRCVRSPPTQYRDRNLGIDAIYPGIDFDTSINLQEYKQLIIQLIKQKKETIETNLGELNRMLDESRLENDMRERINHTLRRYQQIIDTLDTLCESRPNSIPFFPEHLRNLRDFNQELENPVRYKSCRA